MGYHCKKNQKLKRSLSICGVKGEEEGVGKVKERKEKREVAMKNKKNDLNDYCKLTKGEKIGKYCKKEVTRVFKRCGKKIREKIKERNWKEMMISKMLYS